ncbi:hypothetical protein HK104_001659, partial [Borealophlyctis nickersoniae]
MQKSREMVNFPQSTSLKQGRFVLVGSLAWLLAAGVAAQTTSAVSAVPSMAGVPSASVVSSSSPILSSSIASSVSVSSSSNSISTTSSTTAAAAASSSNVTSTSPAAALSASTSTSISASISTSTTTSSYLTPTSTLTPSRSRTTYKNGTPRNGSATADPAYLTTASGIVRILHLTSRLDLLPQSVLDATNAWAESQNLSIQARVFPPEETYDAYVEELMNACRTGQEGMFDVVWVDAVSAGLLSDCLVDLWAWDEGLGSGHDQRILEGGVVGEKLVALPAENSFGLLYYNKDILDRYDFPHGPYSLEEFQTICQTILENERANENYGLTGITGSMVGENLTAWATEWLSAYHATLLTPTNVTIYSETAGAALAQIISWIESGILDTAELGTATTDDARSRFLNGKSIFLRDTPDAMYEIRERRAGFDWAVSPIPNATGGEFVGTFQGWYLGVYKYGKNLAGGVKTVRYLTSLEYQAMNVLKNPSRPMIGTYPQMFRNTTLCGTYGKSACSVYSAITVTTRPSTYAGAYYTNVSSQFTSTLLSIFSGTTTIKYGLDGLDSSLRALLGYAQNNGTDPDIDVPPVVSRPGKKMPSNMGIQLGGLCVIVGVTGVAVTMYRRKQRQELETAGLG